MDSIDGDKLENLSRRNALRLIVGSAGAAVSLPVIGQGTRPVATHCSTHRGAAAQVLQLPPYTAKFFSPQEIRALDALTETIIPTDDHSPGARTARVWEYMDDLVFASDPTTKEAWKQGLSLVDRVAQADYSRVFADCSAAHQIALLEKISRREDNPETPEEKFFVQLKRATIDGYYTSPVGIHQDLQYQGNTAVAEFPGCTHPEHKR